MKVLVSLTCLAVLAFVGYYFFAQYRSYQAAEAASFRRACDDALKKADDPSGLTTDQRRLVQEQLEGCISRMKGI